MRPIRNLSIRHKLVVIIMTTSLAALLLACLGFISYERGTFRAKLAKDFWTLADVLDDSLAPGLAFTDPAALQQQLDPLQAHPHVLAAAVYDKTGQRVSTYERDRRARGFPWPAVAREGSYFQPERLDTFKAIPLAGEAVGTLYIAADLGELATRQQRYLLITGAVLLVSTLAAYALAMWLQRFISQPITELSRTATRVATEQDFTRRATKHSDDELGNLTDHFNDMLAQNQSQQQSLREANDRLEQRVGERTRELECEIAGHERARVELIQAQQRLGETSRPAGMAEIATNVLHNVGNVLNSVSVSAEVVTGKVRQSKAGSLKRVAVLLREHAHDLPEFLTRDPQGRELPAYLIKLAEHLAEPQQGILQELEAQRKSIEHIKEIVAMQQRFARGSGVLETPAVRARIFEPFFTTKELDRGTGLGLSTVGNLVKDHRGFITVDSAVGQGTEFQIFLPAQPDAAAVVAAERLTLPVGHGEWILVVDDEAAIRSIATQSLEMFGYHVVTAKDGAEGLAVFARHQAPIELVITDRDMPVLDGPAMLRRFRDLAPQLKVILASGVDSDTKAPAPADCECDAYRQKPYSADELLRAVDTVLRLPARL